MGILFGPKLGSMGHKIDSDAVEGSVGVNQPDISPGGHGEQTNNDKNEINVDKCLDDNEENDICGGICWHKPT